MDLVAKTSNQRLDQTARRLASSSVSWRGIVESRGASRLVPRLNDSFHVGPSPGQNRSSTLAALSSAKQTLA
jgi:hypothetical protein